MAKRCRAGIVVALYSAVLSGCTATVNVNQALHPVPKDTLSSQPAVSVSPAFSSEVYDRLAVYLRSNASRPVGEGELRQAEDEFMKALVDKGYVVAARSDLDAVLRELRLQRSEVTEQALARAGKILNVPAVLLATITLISSECGYWYGDRYCYGFADLTARLVSVESGEVLVVGSVRGAVPIAEGSSPDQAAGAAARQLAAALPGRRLTQTRPMEETARAQRPPLRPRLYWGTGAFHIRPFSRADLRGTPSFIGPYLELGLAGYLRGIVDGRIIWGINGFPLSTSDSGLTASWARVLSVLLLVGPSGSWGHLKAGAGFGGVFFPDSSALGRDSVPATWSFPVEAELGLSHSVRMVVAGVYVPRQYVTSSAQTGAIITTVGLRFPVSGRQR